jgi:hypothetical protein
MKTDIVRSQTPDGAFWTAELQGGPVSQNPVLGRVPTRAEIRRWVLGSVACGARGVCFWNHRAERLWSYAYEGPATRFFKQWLLSLRWQRLPAFKKLARTLYDHIDGVLAYCKHKVPFGVVEAINGNLRAVIRRGRGYQDHEYLILKAQKSTAQYRSTPSL